MDSTSSASYSSPITGAELNFHLLESARDGYPATIKALIKAGANVNAVSLDSGGTALIAAARKGHTDAVCVLIAAGANVNLASHFGDTALIGASRKGHTDTVSVLIAAGANVNAVNKNNNNGLILAAWYGHTATVSTLINARANVNAVSLDSGTALTKAAQYGYTATVSALISAGANINVPTQYSQTALMLASENNHGNTAFCVLSAMPFEWVTALQGEPTRLGGFATQCRQAVLDVQREVLTIIWSFRRTPALSNINGPIRSVIFNLCPEWYRHRANSDTTLLSKRLMDMLKDRERVVTNRHRSTRSLMFSSSTSSSRSCSSRSTSNSVVFEDTEEKQEKGPSKKARLN